MILQRYETEADRETEKRLGQEYIKYCNPNCSVRKTEDLAAYDFRIIENGMAVGWLEVKKKPGTFFEKEIFPANKWHFTKFSPLPCWFLLEKDKEARLFNMTNIVRKDLGVEGEIPRRKDQPGGSTKVTFFPSSEGSLAYFCT